MAHLRQNLNRMYAWLSRCLEEGAPTPGDAEICETFGFTSTEDARTLLAELADAGRITIKGYGETRTIALGRAKSALAPVRPAPTIARVDPDVERGAARITEIIRRGVAPLQDAMRNIGATTASAEPPPTTAPALAAPESEISTMVNTTGKSVTFVAQGDVLEALKARVANGASYNRAAIDLIEAGMHVGRPVAAPSTEPPLDGGLSTFGIDELLGELGRRYEDMFNAGDIETETARANAAEARLANVLKAATA